LANHSGLKKHATIPWTPAMQTAFNKMHGIMEAHALNAYPVHTKWLNIYTDKSDFQ
jgi:hypothetical protein